MGAKWEHDTGYIDVIEHEAIPKSKAQHTTSFGLSSRVAGPIEVHG